MMCCNKNNNKSSSNLEPMAPKRAIENTCNNEEEGRSRKRQRKSSKSVNFSSDAPKTLEFEKFDAETKADIWYSREDFQVFQFERVLNVQCLQRVVAGDKTPLDPNLVCFRGLEPYRSEQRREKFLRGRQNHVAAILDEQDRQRAEGEDDPEAFREIVAFATHNTLKIAQYQALIDQHEAGLKKIAQKKTASSTNEVEGSPVLTPTTCQSIAVRAA